jgi:hypothetical protein
MRRTMTKLLRTKRPPHEVFLVRGGIKSAPAQHTHVLGKKIRSGDGVPSTLPRQGATSSCRACIKLHRAPGEDVSLPPPTPVDRRHCSTKTKSTED